MTSPPPPLQDGSLDPLALLRRSRGDNEPRDTKLRLLWLRQREPEARVRTKLVSLDDRGVVMSARIELPGGGSTSAHAASPVTDGAIERVIVETELRAIAGALDALGYIVIDSGQATMPPEPSSQPDPESTEPPRRQPPGHVQAIRALRERERATPEAGPEDPRIHEDAEARPQPVEPTPSRSPQRGPAPVDRRPSTVETAPVDLSERRRAAPPEQVNPPAPVADDDADPELEDISWTAFWQWARDTYQIGSRGQVEKLLGVPVDRESPGQLRQMLIAHFDGGSSDES